MSRHATARGALALGALGVVFGDIGTSPLYTVQTVFNPGDPHPLRASAESIFGIVSLIFWSVMIIVTVTYVLLVMRADNDGEGGIMALITLIRRQRVPGGRRAKVALAVLGIFGASLFFGDSVITPAISVLSAIEGVKVAAPSVADLVVPITAAIIVGLFLLQRLGTGAVGRLFGPVMGLWFAVIGAIGVRGIAARPEILKALSPTYALGFLAGHFSAAFFSLAAVVLAVTGAEALYADMGHFGRAPITRVWLILVFPACILSYLGQGALILGDPGGAISSPFFLLVPGWARLPMVFLSAAATVIASQAVITGAFSVTQQAAQLGYLPRLRIAHTSEERMGQIYVPWINWALLASVLTLVITFKSSAALAYAFGMAVTGTITITTLLFFYIVRHHWHKPLWIVATGAAILLTVDLLFFAANLTKLVHGAWLPLLIGVAVFTIMTTWQRGRELVTELRRRDEGPLQAFIDQLHAMKPPLHRVPGTAVFLNRGKATAPLALRANVEHNHILHKYVLVLSIETIPVPHVPVAERLTIDALGHKDDRITYVTARFGYMDEANVPAVLPLIRQADIESPLDEGDVSYFLSTIALRPGTTPGMSRWRKRLFFATAQITADAAEYFRLPRERTVIMGSRIELLPRGDPMALGAQPLPGQTFHGRDPQTVATPTICEISPTRCQARTRLYRDGRLELEGFPVADISDHLADESVTVWLDLRDPDHDDLAVLSEEFGLHPLAVEDALNESQRPKLDRYSSHLFLTGYAARLDTGTGRLVTSETAAFITGRALITVRKDDGLDIGAVVERWDASPDLAKFGVGYLLHGLLDYIVDGHFEAVQSLDDCVEELEDWLFDDIPQDLRVQRRSFQLRKSLVLLRRVVIPMREVVNALMRRDLHVVGDDLMPYYQDIYDHVLRAAEWTDSLRDLVTSILETNLTIQGNRLNIITKKVTGWAAIIAVPTLITGFFGMNVPYPGFSQEDGFAASIAIMVLTGLVLYLIFKRKDWL